MVYLYLKIILNVSWEEYICILVHDQEVNNKDAMKHNAWLYCNQDNLFFIEECGSYFYLSEYVGQSAYFKRFGW
jgi:hypothetical protein